MNDKHREFFVCDYLKIEHQKIGNVSTDKMSEDDLAFDGKLATFSIDVAAWRRMLALLWFMNGCCDDYA